MLAMQLYHSRELVNTMGLGQDFQLGQIPGVTDIAESVNKFTAGVKEVKNAVDSFTQAVAGFKIRTESAVNVSGLEKVTIKAELPSGGEILKRALPPLLVTTAAVVGVAYLVGYFLKRTCPIPARPARVET